MKYGLAALIGIALLVAIVNVAHINPTNIFNEIRSGNLTSLSPVSSSPTPMKDNWLTYTNTTFGYSLQYPSNWIINTAKAESKLDKKAPFCYYANMLSLTPPNNVGTLDISFGPSCVGSQPFSVARTAQITIQNTPVTKAYESLCDTDSKNPNCSKLITAIVYTSSNCKIDSQGVASCGDLRVFDQTMLITLVPKPSSPSQKYGTISLDSPVLAQFDNTLDKIVESIKVPTTPLHPEIEHLAK